MAVHELAQEIAARFRATSTASASTSSAAAP
jgi:hypothetical protein